MTASASLVSFFREKTLYIACTDRDGPGLEVNEPQRAGPKNWADTTVQRL